METAVRWALVTGACSGIGLACARELAGRGYALFLVSHRERELADAADEIKAIYQVATQAITLDLARPEAASELYHETRLHGADVEILISNAGMLLFGEVADIDPAQAEAMLHLHVLTPSLLAHYFGHDMRARGSGHMLFVSSASTWCDFPGIAHYGSSKRYLRSFAASLREELRPWGVNVTCLAPGAVATNLYDSGSRPAKLAARWGLLVDPARVAKMAIGGMFGRKPVVLPGLSAKSMALCAALTPRWIVRLARTRTDLLSRPRA